MVSPVYESTGSRDKHEILVNAKRSPSSLRTVKKDELTYDVKKAMEISLTRAKERAQTSRVLCVTDIMGADALRMGP